MILQLISGLSQEEILKGERIATLMFYVSCQSHFACHSLCTIVIDNMTMNVNIYNIRIFWSSIAN
jgi:hypothetical protein